MPYITWNKLQIHYHIQGDGPPLVLISGLGQTHRFWRELTPQLAQHFQVITFDNRGMGESKAPFTLRYSVNQLAKDTWGLIQTLGLEQPAILGHSLGAAIAFETTRQHPQEVSKLLMASGLYPGTRVAPAQAGTVKALLGGFGKLHNMVEQGIRVATSPLFPFEQPQLFEQLVQARLTAQESTRVIMRQSTAGTAYLATDKLKKPFSVPLCLIYGEDDRVTLPENGRRIQTRVPSAQLHIIPKAGHLVPWEQPTLFTQTIINFLKDA